MPWTCQCAKTSRPAHLPEDCAVSCKIDMPAINFEHQLGLFQLFVGAGIWCEYPLVMMRNKWPTELMVVVTIWVHTKSNHVNSIPAEGESTSAFNWKICWNHAVQYWAETTEVRCWCAQFLAWHWCRVQLQRARTNQSENPRQDRCDSLQACATTRRLQIGLENRRNCQYRILGVASRSIGHVKISRAAQHSAAYRDQFSCLDC